MDEPAGPATDRTADPLAGLSIWDILDLARTQLGMDLAFVGCIHGDQEIIRWVVGDAAAFGVQPGRSVPLRDTYCRYVLAGDADNIVPDFQAPPAADLLPGTQGSYIGVPILLPTGTVYGMLCCRSLHTDPTLNERDTAFLRVLAAVLGPKIHRDQSTAKDQLERYAIVQELLQETNGGVHMVYQPIVDVEADTITGIEALARFGSEPQLSPSHWFDMARQVGLGVALEYKAVQLAMRTIRALPDDMFLSVNVSPDTLLSGRLLDLVDTTTGPRMVLEVTEHAAIDDYPAVSRALVPLREHGVRLAVDDAGSGYASLSRILQLAPDFMKLDTTLIRHVEDSRAQSALTSALITFGSRINAELVAEGVETDTELAALRVLGVPLAQGYYLHRPQSLETVLQHAHN